MPGMKRYGKKPRALWELWAAKVIAVLDQTHWESSRGFGLPEKLGHTCRGRVRGRCWVWLCILSPGKLRVFIEISPVSHNIPLRIWNPLISPTLLERFYTSAPSPGGLKSPQRTFLEVLVVTIPFGWVRKSEVRQVLFVYRNLSLRCFSHFKAGRKAKVCLCLRIR